MAVCRPARRNGAGTRFDAPKPIRRKRRHRDRREQYGQKYDESRNGSQTAPTSTSALPTAATEQSPVSPPMKMMDDAFHYNVRSSPTLAELAGSANLSRSPAHQPRRQVMWQTTWLLHSSTLRPTLPYCDGGNPWSGPRRSASNGTGSASGEAAVCVLSRVGRHGAP
jgi:hypothetical protein